MALELAPVCEEEFLAGGGLGAVWKHFQRAIQAAAKKRATGVLVILGGDWHPASPRWAWWRLKAV